MGTVVPDFGGGDVPASVESNQPNIDAIVAKWSANTETPLFKSEAPAAEPAPVPAGGGTSPVEHSAAGIVEKPEVPGAAAPAPAVEVPITSKQLSLLAEKEAQLLLRERQLAERERQLQSSQESRDEILGRLKRETAQVLREAGLSDLGAVAGELWAAELGDDAPPEFRQKVQERSAAAKNKELEQRLVDLEKRAAEAANQAAFQTRVELMDRDMKQTLADVPSEMKFLKRLATVSPEEAYRTVATIAAHEIQQTGRWPNARDVAKFVDEQLRLDWERLRPEDYAATSPQAEIKSEGNRQLTPAISSADAADTVDRAPPKLTGEEPAEYYIKRGEQAVKRLGGLFKP